MYSWLIKWNIVISLKQMKDKSNPTEAQIVIHPVYKQ